MRSVSAVRECDRKVSLFLRARSLAITGSLAITCSLALALALTQAR